jgi:hypothetical protein
VFDRTLLNVVYGKLKSILEVANALGTVDPLPADRRKIGGKSGGMVLQLKKIAQSCLANQDSFVTSHVPATSRSSSRQNRSSAVRDEKWAYLSSQLTT